MLSTQLPRQQADPSIAFREKLCDLLVACGFQEVISYSLTSGERLAKITPATKYLSPLRVANPVSAEQEYLRSSLQPGLLATLSSNQKHEEGGIRLFEIGKVYSPKEGDLPEERQMLVGVLSGPRVERSWLGEKCWLDFFDAKGVVEILLERAGIEADFEVDEALLHPGRAAQIVIGGDVVGVVGELHPKVAESFDLLPQPVALFELEIDKLSSHLGLKRYRPLPRFPESVRDMAIVVDAWVSAKKIQDIIRSFPLVSQVSLFDLYIGKQIPGGKKSLAFRVVYQSPTRTLTEEEVEKVGREIMARLSQEAGASLRSL
jgi:phenylalanyl-tRNA synthetase beta chain